MTCKRCDWKPDPTGPKQDQVAAHAIDAGHPLCIVCFLSLTTVETLTCEQCLTKARELLSGIVTMFTELPHHLGHLPPVGLSDGHGGGDGRQLPGGEVLTLLSGGSEGLAEDAETTREGDPRPVSFELGWWALAWQEERDEVEELGHRPAALVMAAAGYLERRCRWAANNHLGFDDFVKDLRRIHATLERATCRDSPTEKANADCFDCGGDLIRRTDPRTGLAHRHWECQDCAETYDEQRYALALSEAWQHRVEGWVSVTDVVRITARSRKTLDSWTDRGLVRVSFSEAGRKLVWWPDVQVRLRRSA